MLDVDGVVLDIDGVLVDAWRPIEGAAEAVARLRDAGLPLALLTNTTTRSRDEIVAALGDAGIAVDRAEVTTAAVATSRWLTAHHPGARCMVLNDGGGTRDLEGVRLVDDAPDVVVIGAPGPDTCTWPQLNAVLEAVLDGAVLVGMHRSLKWRAGGRWLLDGGAYLHALELATGVEATVVGKPAASVFTGLAGVLGTAPRRTVMVGDSITTDVLAAQAAGLRGVLVRTGGFREADLAAAGGSPDALVDSIRDVPDILVR